MTPEAPGAAARRLWLGFNRGRRRFRRWRRERPFWGGLFLMLGGAQLFLSTQLSLGDIEISFGPEGFLAVLLPLVLLLCGVLLWVTPQHRHFYSIIGTVTAVYSLLGLNLGGWFLGMLFGIIGGALGFSWTPVQPAEPAADPEPDPTLLPEPDERPTEDLTGPLTDQPPGTDQQAPVRAPRPDPPTYAAVAVPLVLLVAALAAPAPQPAPGQLPCLIPILCPDDDPDETPEPDPGASPTPSPTPGGPAPTPGPTGGPEPTDPPEDGDGEDPEPSPSAEPSPIPTVEPADGQPLVSAGPALMTADRLSQQNFRFDGITELPTADGPVRVLQFSFSRSVATNFVLSKTVNGATTQVTADPLVIAGDVVFYTSRFSGRLFGTLPLELTPDSPLVDLLELVDIPLPVFFTDVNLDLVFTSGAELTADGFALTV